MKIPRFCLPVIGCLMVGQPFRSPAQTVMRVHFEIPQASQDASPQSMFDLNDPGPVRLCAFEMPCTTESDDGEGPEPGGLIDFTPITSTAVPAITTSLSSVAEATLFVSVVLLGLSVGTFAGMCGVRR